MHDLPDLMKFDSKQRRIVVDVLRRLPRYFVGHVVHGNDLQEVVDCQELGNWIKSDHLDALINELEQQ